MLIPLIDDISVSSISTPWLNGLKEGCFQLYYHMYGDDIGSLGIYTQENKGTQAIVAQEPRITGDQGNQWLLLQINVSSTEYTKV